MGLDYSKAMPGVVLMSYAPQTTKAMPSGLGFQMTAWDTRQCWVPAPGGTRQCWPWQKRKAKKKA